MVFALLLAVMGAIQTSLGAFSNLMSPEAYGLLGVAVGIIVAGLRVLTTEAMVKK